MTWIDRQCLSVYTFLPYTTYKLNIYFMAKSGELFNRSMMNAIIASTAYNTLLLYSSSPSCRLFPTTIAAKTVMAVNPSDDGAYFDGMIVQISFTDSSPFKRRYPPRSTQLMAELRQCYDSDWYLTIAGQQTVLTPMFPEDVLSFEGKLCILYIHAYYDLLVVLRSFAKYALLEIYTGHQ